MPRNSVAEIKDGDRVSGVFLVQSKAVPLNKHGKPYLSLTLADRTGSLDARMWDNVEETRGRFEAADFVDVDGQVVDFNGRLQLRVDSLHRVDASTVNPADYTPTTKGDVEAQFHQLVKLVESVEDPWVRKLLLSMLAEPYFEDGLKRAPAAKTIHHAYLGGLLEHTLSMAKLADLVSGHYSPRVNRSYLIAGCVLHDIGKLAELSPEPGFEYTDDGRLLGHIAISLEWVGQFAARIDDFPYEVERLLKHLVIAHHGSLQFGSPRVPMTLEAMLTHAIDDLDSKMNQWLSAIDREAGATWTSFQPQLERVIYVGDRDHYNASGQEASPGAKAKHKGPRRFPKRELRPGDGGGGETKPAGGDGGGEAGEPKAAKAEGGDRPQNGAPRGGKTDRPDRPERGERSDKGGDKPQPSAPSAAAPLTYNPFAALKVGS